MSLKLRVWFFVVLKPFDTLILCSWRNFLWKSNFEKVSRRQQKHDKLPSMQRVTHKHKTNACFGWEWRKTFKTLLVKIIFIKSKDNAIIYTRLISWHNIFEAVLINAHLEQVHFGFYTNFGLYGTLHNSPSHGILQDNIMKKKKLDFQSCKALLCRSLFSAMFGVHSLGMVL